MLFFAFLSFTKLAASTYGTSGLRLEVFNNTQALSVPSYTKIVPTASLTSSSVHINGSAPLSLRLLGTWTPAADGNYIFACECDPADHLVSGLAQLHNL